MRILKLFANLSIKQIWQDVFQITSLLEYSLKLGSRICCPTKVLAWSHVIHSPQLQQKLTGSLQSNVTWGCIREVEKILLYHSYCIRKKPWPSLHTKHLWKTPSCFFFLDWIHFFPHNSLASNFVILQPVFNRSIPVTSFISICLTNRRPQSDTVF